jgi:hypothetical protein
MLDGVRAMTAGRDVVGVLQKEDATTLHIKTKDAKAPIQVPKSALLRPHEAIKVPESDAYSPDEMVDLRLAKANEKDYASMKELGAFAASVKLHERAKEYYQKAAGVADAKSKEEIEEILARNESLIKEERAAALVTQAKEFVKSTEFAKAIETAKKLLSEYGDTEVARQNKSLPDDLQKKAKDYETNRTEYLAENVPAAYKERRSALFNQYGSTKFKIAEALQKANTIDDEVVADLAKRMKATPEEIKAAWEKRDLRPRSVSYGEGSWIVKGGKDGGLDTDQKTQPNQNKNQNNNNNNNGGFNFGRNNNGGNRGGNNNPNNQPQPLGKKLETKDEWWTATSTSDRRNFVEAEYAKNSSAVKKELKTKKCIPCKGEGTIKETRHGYPCDCVCSRCHGAKEEETVIYQ